MDDIQQLAIKHGYYYKCDKLVLRFCEEHGAYGFINNNTDFCLQCNKIPKGFSLDENGVPVPPNSKKITLSDEEIEQLKKLVQN